MKPLVFISHFLCSWCSIINIYYLAVIYVLKQLLFNKSKDYKTKSCYSRNIRAVCIVTGGTQGIGLEVCRYLVRAGMHVIIASNQLAITLDELKQDAAESNGRVELSKLDLSSMKSVKDFANNFLDRDLPLHLLVNNAGIMLGPYNLTEDGFESQMAVNYFGHFLLTCLLLPQLAKTGTATKKSRIVNVTSCCHFAGSINLNDLNCKEFYSSYECYAQSKLAIVMATKSLHKYLTEKLLNITVNAVHPGVANTQLYKNSPLSMIPRLMRLFLMSPKRSAEDLEYLCLSSEIEGLSGMYIEYCFPVQPNRLADNEDLQVQLWNETCRLLNLQNLKIGAC